MLYLTINDLGFVMGYSQEDTAYKARKLKQGLKPGRLFYKTYSFNKVEEVRRSSEQSSGFPPIFWEYGIKAEKPLRRLYSYTPDGRLPIINCYSLKDAKQLIQEHIRSLEKNKRMKYHPVEYAIGKVVFFKPVAIRIIMNLKSFEKYTYKDDGSVEYKESSGKITRYLCLVRDNQVIKVDKAAYKVAAKYGSIRSYDFESERQVKLVLKDNALAIDVSQ